MTIIPGKWTWCDRHPKNRTYNPGLYYSVEPGPDYVGWLHPGYTLWFTAMGDRRYGLRRFRRTYRTYVEATRAAHRAFRFIDRRPTVIPN